MEKPVDDKINKEVNELEDDDLGDVAGGMTVRNGETWIAQGNHDKVVAEPGSHVIFGG